MLNHTFSPDGIMVLEPTGPLEAADFATLKATVDPYIAEHGSLRGVMIHAKSFPGWADLEAALAHLRFVESHHQKLSRLAIVSDSPLLTEVPRLVAHFLHPEVKHFAASEYEDALQWLRQGPTDQ